MKRKEFTGDFGDYGGRHVPEDLKPCLLELDAAFNHYINDAGFLRELELIQKNFIGRPTPLLHAENATRELGGAEIYLKLECLANTGAHKINNAIGQALLAKKMGKKRIIAETGAGQHGLATASACAKMGLECHIYMGEKDVARQRPNVFGMELLGATVVPVASGAKTLSDAVDAAFAVWAADHQDTHYLIGSALGPSPYPDMVREFQSVIGKEAKRQLLEQTGRLPDLMSACVGGGSNAIGFFSEFLDDPGVRLLGVEAGGISDAPGEHSARMGGQGRPSVHHGYKSMFLRREDGELLPTYSISAGLDYVGIGPQLAHLGRTGRLEFMKATDDEALEAMQFFARTEGIVAALESSHGLHGAMVQAQLLGKGKVVVANVSGRGDKDIFITGAVLNQGGKWISFLRDEVRRFDERQKP